MMRQIVFAVVVAAQMAFVPAFRGSPAGAAKPDPQDVNADAAALAEFNQRIAQYMQLREGIVAEIGPGKPTRDLRVIRSRAQELAARIRARRAAARHGDIFTAEVRPVFRRLLRPEFKGQAGQDIRETLRDDAPSPDAVPLEVNAKYPAKLPLPTTPPAILEALPKLPTGLAYRIVGKDLILLDQPADVILDFIRNAIP